MSRRIAMSYVDALLAGKADDQAVEQIATFADACVAGSELQVVLTAPVITVEKRAAAAKSVAEAMGLGDRVQAVIGRIVANGRLDLLSQIVEGAQAAVDDANGVTRVVAETATAWDAKRKKEFESASSIEKAVWEWKERPDLMGGVRVRIADQVWDGSVRAQLHALRTTLTTS